MKEATFFFFLFVHRSPTHFFLGLNVFPLSKKLLKFTAKFMATV